MIGFCENINDPLNSIVREGEFVGQLSGCIKALLKLFPSVLPQRNALRAGVGTLV
jgi:hypothetical protein